ncbi:MAG: isoaspartyl peptidase/L-asparaginase [Acidobacteriota bacterium]
MDRNAGRIALVVHGGAWVIPDEEKEACRAGVLASLDRGIELLERGASAREAVIACVRILEDDPVFDAGRGSHLTLDGVCELDALLMDGSDLRAGAVAALRRVKNPIEAANTVLEKSLHVMLVGEGAERFYAAHGGVLCDPSELIVPREQARFEEARRAQAGAATTLGGSTVGAVARDRDGHVASATSTGGTPAKLAGRIGDSPLIGCGGYADDLAGAVSSTGYGEAIMRVVLAKGVIDDMARGLSPQAAADWGIERLSLRTGSMAGCIAVGRSGDVGWAHNTPDMAAAAFWIGPGGERRRHVLL